MYCRKMVSFVHDDKLLIHFFQDSLTGAASSWYTYLERSRIRCWKDLVDAFLKQYKYNIDMAPNRMQLQSRGVVQEDTKINQIFYTQNAYHLKGVYQSAFDMLCFCDK